MGNLVVKYCPINGVDKLWIRERAREELKCENDSHIAGNGLIILRPMNFLNWRALHRQVY